MMIRLTKYQLISMLKLLRAERERTASIFGKCEPVKILPKTMRILCAERLVLWNRYSYAKLTQKANIIINVYESLGLLPELPPIKLNKTKPYKKLWKPIGFLP